MLLGADIGGTFTDLVWWTGSELRRHKVPTTPEAPERGLLDGIAQLGANSPDVLLIHGSTIATNALLERHGARVVLLTTEGFADVLEIGRQNRLGIYRARVVKPQHVVPAERRLEVHERLDAYGEVLVPLAPDELHRVCQALRSQRPEAVAICLLHAYANDAHERLLADALRDLPFVYASSDVDPTYREYERTSTTVLNAYVAPKVAAYVERLRTGLAGPLRLIGSDGGRQPSGELARPASMILSGPAGGVVGAYAVARAAGLDDVITLDMGGTSTDVALLRGQPERTREGMVDGLPLRMPMLDIFTIGAGGGSIARFDRGGALAVGPESAGANPGPACYGRGGQLFTVTDAHALLGHLLPDYFLGGRMSLDLAAATSAAESVLFGTSLSAEELSTGVIAVTNAAMERAVRTVSARRGHDPADFTLLCFGGAGGLSAVDLACALGMRGVFMPAAAGTLSALGMLLSETRVTASASVLRIAEATVDDDIVSVFDELAAACERQLDATDAAEEVLIDRMLDMRYRGQSYELTVAWDGTVAGTVAAFADEHLRRFGYADEAPIEIVNASVALRVVHPGFPLPEITAGEPSPPTATVEAWFGGQRQTTVVYHLDALVRDQRVAGPALLASTDATFLVPPGFSARIDRYGNIHVPLRPAAEKEAAS